MSPEALLLAQHRVTIELHASAAVFRVTASQKGEDFGARGMGLSSMVILAIRDLIREELEARAQLAWAICSRLLDADDAVPDQETRGAVLAVLETAIRDQSADLDDIYEKYRKRMDGPWPTLEDARLSTLSRATSDMDIDLLRRRRKRLPLGDVLLAPRYSAALMHWKKARAVAEADPADAISGLREGVLAIESLARVVTPGGCATLGDCIKKLRTRKLLDPGADKILEGVWTYANSVPGSRHGGVAVATLV